MPNAVLLYCILYMWLLWWDNAATATLLIGDFCVAETEVFYPISLTSFCWMSW